MTGKFGYPETQESIQQDRDGYQQRCTELQNELARVHEQHRQEREQVSAKMIRLQAAASQLIEQLTLDDDEGLIQHVDGVQQAINAMGETGREALQAHDAALIKELRAELVPFIRQYRHNDRDGISASWHSLDRFVMAYQKGGADWVLSVFESGGRP